MKSLDDLDHWIGGMVRRWTSRVSGAPHAPETLEIRREILTDIRNRIEPRGNGGYFFPYNTIAVHVASPFPDEDDWLGQDVRELLSAAGCPIPANLTVTIETTEDQEVAPFRIDYSRAKSASAVTPAARPRARLIVIRGKSDVPELEIDANQVNIGRMKEVRGERGDLRRRNDLAFDESETTVSREQAAIRYDAGSGKYRLHDYLSQRPTIVLREGRLIEVPRDPTRGVQLKSGDEIHIGEARLRFELT